MEQRLVGALVEGRVDDADPQAHQVHELIAIHARARRRDAELRARHLGYEEDRAPRAVVAELDEHLRLEATAALLAAVERLPHAIEACGRKRLEVSGRRRIGQEVSAGLEARAVRLPSRRQIDAGPRRPVVVEVDEATGGHGADRSARQVEAAGRESIHGGGT